MKTIKETILADLRPYSQAVKGKSALAYYHLFPGFKYSCWLRLHEWSRKKSGFKLLASIATRRLKRLSLLTGIQINAGTQIGTGLYIPHFGGIVVNPGAKIGDNCYLSHNVTIGKVHAGEKAGVPRIGDNVFIGTGSVILGNIQIGDHAVIGVNSVVTNDVPPGVFVAGSPAKIISEKTKADVLGRMH